jgi:hypothetical protein
LPLALLRTPARCSPSIVLVARVSPSRRAVNARSARASRTSSRSSSARRATSASSRGEGGRSGRRSGSFSRSACASSSPSARISASRAGGGGLRACVLGGGFGVKGLLAHALQPAPVADRLHAPRQLGARLGRLHHLREVRGRLPCCDRAHPCRARLAGGGEHAGSRAQPKLLAAVRGELRAGRQRQQVEQRNAQLAADVLVGLARLDAQQPLEGQQRIGQPRRLRGGGRIGIGLRQQRVQPRVRRKRDAHRVVSRQRSGQ